jgi:hypothetical protein
MVGGIVIVTKEAVRDEAVKGGVVSTTVRNEETLGNGGMNQNIVNVCVGEEEAYREGKYLVNCTSGIVRSMDMWVQWSMTVVRGVSSTLTYGCPRGVGGEGRQLVNCTGNPRVLLRVPRPGPAENPYPSKGYRFFHGYASSNPRVYPYPYPQQVFTGTG